MPVSGIDCIKAIDVVIPILDQVIRLLMMIMLGKRLIIYQMKIFLTMKTGSSIGVANNPAGLIVDQKSQIRDIPWTKK